MKKILLIEDNEDVRENIAEILTLAQYTVFTATNGKEGVELAVQKVPDLIICDIMMPVLDGHGVLHMLSKNDTTAGIPFIFLTARAERSDMRKGMELGADDYLTKPFDDLELLNAIEVRLKKNEILKKEFTKSLNGVNEFLNEARGIESLKQLSEEREIRHVQKKEEIFREGSYPKGVYFISKGKVKIFQKNSQGKELITSLLKEGDFFGFLSLMSDEPYHHSAVAMENTEIYMIPKDDFFALLYKNADVAKKFIELLSNNVKESEQHLLSLAYHSVRKRLAETLVNLSDKYKENNQQEFSMKVSREDLANLVGTAIETVIRTLSDFKEENFIAISGSNITILDYNKLKMLKN
jgi:CRP-like cAMP-binding protein/CheY-like chemotaxis protein